MDPIRTRIWKIGAHCFFLCLIIIEILEWLVTYQLIDMEYKKIVPAVQIAIMLMVVLESGIQFRIMPFPVGRVFLLIGLLMVVYAVVSQRLLTDLYWIIRVFYWIVGGYFVYRMTLFGIITRKSLLIAIGIVLIINSMLAFTFILNPSREAIQNIGIYTVVWCLPYIMLVEKKFFKYGLLGIACVAIVLSMKRGAILAMMTAMGSYAFFFFLMEKNVKALVRCVAIFLLSIVLLLFTLQILSEVKPDFVAARLGDFHDTDELERLGSGRIGIYTMLTQHFMQSFYSNPLHLLFGFGNKGVEELIAKSHGIQFGAGTNAHSDWMEFIYDYGLLGVFLILLLYQRIIALTRRCYIERHPYALPLIMCFLIMVMKNIYSGLFFSPQSIYFSMFIGYIFASLIGDNEKEPKPV